MGGLGSGVEPPRPELPARSIVPMGPDVSRNPGSGCPVADTEQSLNEWAANHVEAEPGTPVEVEWGNELFQPLAYHGFNTGSFKARGVVRAGESVADAVYRLWLELNTVAMRIRDEKSSAYLREVERLHAAE